jgi:hypothetical protein
MLNPASLARASSLGLPKSMVKAVLNDIQKWVTSNGEEWTVERLKAYKVAFIHRIAGLPHSENASIAFHSDGTPVGSFRYLWRLLDHDRDRAVKGFNILLAYTQFTSIVITSRQMKKFIASVERERVASDALYRASSLINLGCSGISVEQAEIDRLRKRDRILPAAIAREGKSAPVLTIVRDDHGLLKVIGVRTVPEDQGIEASDSFLLVYNQFVRRFWTWLVPVLNAYRLEDLQSIYDKRRTAEDGIAPVVGTIGFIQEPGFKLRSVANPLRLLQLVLFPIGVALFSALRRIPNDACFNQESGVERVRSALQANETVYSFDLSSATDNFPLELQLRSLEKMGLNPDSQELLEYICSGRWSVREGNGKPFVAWTVGQPLGLFPSFAMFSLAHHALVRGCARSVGGDPDKYAILGDDVCIWDSATAVVYQKTMEDLGCPISEAKSIRSNKVAEFAGQVITRDRTFKGPKWRPLVKRNQLDYLRATGKFGLAQVNSKARKAYAFLAPLLQPIGFEQNGGASLEERVRYTLAAIDVQRELRNQGLRFPSLSQRLLATRLRRFGRAFLRIDPEKVQSMELAEYHSVMNLVQQSRIPPYLMQVLGSGIASDLMSALSEQEVGSSAGGTLPPIGDLSVVTDVDSVKGILKLADEVTRRYGAPSWYPAKTKQDTVR